MKISQWAWMLFCILFTASFSIAQVATTSLRGAVKDPSGALLPGATVTLTNNSNRQTLTATSNEAGAYAFSQIPPAKYTITVSAPGFGDQSKTAELLVNQPATVDFSLTMQASSVTVDVSASAQTLNTTDASLGNAVGNAEIQSIPSETRNVPDLLSLQPGVLYIPVQQFGTGDSRSGAVNGSRSDQGNVTLDGVDDNDQVGGFAFTGVLRQTQDSVEEFRVVTGGSNADSGRSSGAQVSMVTKSGTNKFHGAAYEYHRPTFTVANDWFNKQAQLNSDEANVPGKVIRNIFGGDFGGPIIKDRLFFFANYEGLRKAENTQVSRTVPTSSYRAGSLVYPDADGNAITLSPAQVAQLDAACQICNTSDYPNDPGPNPNALAFFTSMPAANGLNLGDGYNTGSYSFSSPSPQTQNTSIGRIDFILSDKHRVFARGNLQKDTSSGVEQFPGQPPSTIYEDNSKGATAGDTWTISPRLINDIRYGYVRQGFSNRGAGKGDYVNFRFIDTPTSQARSSITIVPVHNVVDNLSWTKGNHTISAGGNWRLVQQGHSTDTNSYNSATTNPYWLGGNPPDPADIGAAGVNDGFGNSYAIAYANLIGTVPEITKVFNYKLTTATSGTALSDGTSIDRHFKSNEFEWYVQDAWRVLPNLTITFGVRHTILQTPYETRGQQVTPTIDTHAWYLKREAAAEAGQVYEPDLEFAPAGKYYNKPGFWPKSKHDFAPRLAIAYSPNVKTSFRAGAGIYYDHYGEALVNHFDQKGSYGMASQVSNPAGVYGYEGNSKHLPAPRFLGRNTLPNIDVGASPETISFPYTPAEGNFAITTGLDSKLHTPYSETFNLSFEHELPGGFSMEMAYMGRYGRHLLQQLDLAEPVNYKDPGGAGDYYSAGSQLSRAVDANGGNYGLNYAADGKTPISSVVNVAPIQYFENVFPFMAGVDYAGESATQAIYNNEWAPYRANLGATTALSDIDFYCGYGCPADYQSKFWQNQFSALYSFASIGMSYYNSGQFTLRHPTSHGLTFNISYTWSHSIDWGSDTERSNFQGSSTTNTGSFSEILNTWKPYLNKGDSDFDTRHLITADWSYVLPVGRGKHFAANANRLVDGFIGGWQWSGVERWSGGLPFSLFEPGWTTDWEIGSFGVQTAPIKMRRHLDAQGNPQYFDNPDAINNGISSGTPLRLPYPGEAGQRNTFRGDGFFEIDSGLTKAWKIHESQSVKFAWEVYNVTNSVRFDPASIGAGLTGGNLGVASSLLTVPRRMQFSLRYDF